MIARTEPATRRSMLLHIGFPKTGTTFLQHRVFPRLPGVANLGRPSPDYEADASGLRALLLSADAATFRARVNTVAAEAAAWRAGHNAPRAVLSDEHMATGCLTSPVAEVLPATILHRAAALFPEAHVLVVIRSQPAILAAEYANQLRMGRTRLSSDAWLAEAAAATAPNLLDAFDFEARIGEAAAAFGADRVHVAVYEDLTNDADRFVHQLAEAIGCTIEAIHPNLTAPPVNTTTGGERAYLALRRHLPEGVRRNPLLKPARRLLNLDRMRRLARHMGPSRPPTESFGPDALTRIRSAYAASNRRLATQLGRDLAAMGYP